MISNNFKFKNNSLKEQHASRRIRTQVNENSKKISFYLPKAPLNENKKILNQSQSQCVPKKQKTIKSIVSSKAGPMIYKLTTEPYQKGLLTYNQKQAIEQLFVGKKNTHSATSSSVEGVKKQAINDVSKLSGINRYEIQNKVGSGTFGTVFKARDKKSLQTVAIKKVHQDRKYKNRQLEILKMISHPNVLQMKDHFVTYQGQKQFLNVVTDFYNCNLYEGTLKFKRKGQVPRLYFKVLAYQMFRSLFYLAQPRIAHRDIKPQNILINEANWKLVICDFGSAKKLQCDEPNISYICSRCYRAPELIFGNTNYTTQIDMWSVGCVLAQMVLFEPIFRGESNIDQLVQIIRVLGTPTQQQIFEMNPQADFKQQHLPKISARSWDKVFKKSHLGQQFLHLIASILAYSPKSRITPIEALSHSFFDQIRDEITFNKLKAQYNIPDLFDFRKTKECKLSILEKLIPKWYN